MQTLVMRGSTSLFALVLSAVCVADGPFKIPINFSLGIYSKDVWRGINAVDAMNSQWSFALPYGNVTLGLFGTTNLTHDPDAGNANPFFKTTEIDTSLDYLIPIGSYSLDLGVYDYQYPTQGVPRTQELYAIASFPGVWSPQLSAYKDVQTAGGWYFALSGSYTAPRLLPNKVPLNLTANIGYFTWDDSLYYFGVAKSAFGDLTATASAPFALRGGWTLTPSLNGAYLLDNDLAASLGGPRGVIWLGVSLSKSF